MKNVVIIGVVASIGFVSQAFACGFEGSAVRSDGSKVDGTAKISTSWNSKKAYPRNGYYSLELGSSACGESITLYADGKDKGRYTLPSSGMKTVNVTIN